MKKNQDAQTFNITSTESQVLKVIIEDFFYTGIEPEDRRSQLEANGIDEGCFSSQEAKDVFTFLKTRETSAPTEITDGESSISVRNTLDYLRGLQIPFDPSKEAFDALCQRLHDEVMANIQKAILERFCNVANSGNPVKLDDIINDLQRIEDTSFASGLPLIGADVFSTSKIDKGKAYIQDILSQEQICYIVAESKAGKSWLALQAGVCISTHTPFLGLFTNQARVLMLQTELAPYAYQERLKMVCNGLEKALGQKVEASQDLIISNAAGISAERIASQLPSAIRRTKAEVIIIDCLYSLIPDENDQRGVKAFLSRLRMLTRTYHVSFVLVHHTSKGFSGDKQTIDLTSGSGVFARDFDGQIALLKHSADDQAKVLRFITRNGKAPDEMTAIFKDGVYVVDKDLEPSVLTSATYQRKTYDEAEKKNRQRILNFVATLDKSEASQELDMTDDGVPTGKLKDAIKKELNIGRDQSKRIIDELVTEGKFARKNRSGILYISFSHS